MPRYNYRRVRTTRRSDARAGVSLLKRRKWCSDDDSGDDPQNKDGDDPQKDDDSFDFDALPDNVQQYIHGLRQESGKYRLGKKEMALKLAETENKMSNLEEARKVELEREGNFQELNRTQELELTDLRIKAEKAERLEKVMIANNETELAKIPEHLRELYPDGTPEQQSTWLRKAVSKLTAPLIPDLDGGAGGQSRGQRTTVKLSNEEKAIAANMRMTEEEYQAARDS